MGMKTQTSLKTQVDLIAYEDFARDWNALAPAAKLSVGKLLKCLQNNPYDPDLQQRCDLDSSGERYAFTVPEGYVVYWQVAQSGPLSVLALPSITIRLTGINRR